MLRAAIAVTIAVAASVALAGAATPHPQHDLTASSHKRVVNATLGSHCTPTGGAMVCADSTYPLETTTRLPIHPGGRILLRFRSRPTEVFPELRNRRSAPVRWLRARRAGARSRVIRLPRRLPKNVDRLGIFVSYARGSADFEIDLKRHRH